MLKKGSCKTCFFNVAKKGKKGRCRRNPPQYIKIGDAYNGYTWVSAFPQVDSNEWCGEWKLGDKPK